MTNFPQWKSRLAELKRDMKPEPHPPTQEELDAGWYRMCAKCGINDPISPELSRSIQAIWRNKK